jgi:hypothetical protein
MRGNIDVPAWVLGVSGLKSALHACNPTRVQFFDAELLGRSAATEYT